MSDSLGYKCPGCGEKFLYADYEKDHKALEAAWDHVEEEHNTPNNLVGVEDPDAGQ